MASSVETSKPVKAGRAPIKQARSQLTFDRLVETGLRLSRDRELDSIPVAEIAKEAGYSVGAFYARFKTKDEYNRALVERYAAIRREDAERVFGEADDDQLIEVYFEAQVRRLFENRYFWRASLYRSFQDTTFWEPFRAIVRLVGDRFIERAERRVARPLTEDEKTNIRFAIQVTNGAINNAMINRPGPVAIEDPEFIARVVRAFRLVSDWDALT